VELDAVEARFPGPPGGRGIGADEFLHVPFVYFLLGRRILAFPPGNDQTVPAGNACGGKESRVGKLDRDLAPRGVDGGGYLLQPRQAIVAIDSQLPRRGPPFGTDEGVARDDQSHTSPGQGGHGFQILRPGAALFVRHALPGGRADEAVFQLQTADGAHGEYFLHVVLPPIFSPAG